MAGSTTPDGIQYPTGDDTITPLRTWFANLANSVQTALTDLRNTVNTRSHGRASRVTSVQAVTGTSAVLSFNSLAAGASNIVLSGGGLRVSVAGVYLLTTDLVVTRTAGNVGTARDFVVAVNGSAVESFPAAASPAGPGTNAIGQFAIALALSVNDVVTITSSGSQGGDFAIGSSISLTRVSA